MGTERAISIELPEPFGPYKIARQWIPKGILKRGDRAIPRDGIPPRPGIFLTKVERVVVGDTGYRGLTAQAAASDPRQVCGHFIVGCIKQDDDDQPAIYECVPALTSRVGIVEQAHFMRQLKGQSNLDKSSITVSLCFGSRIDAAKTVACGVALVAFICCRFGLTADAVVEARVLDPARDDPEQPLKAAGLDFTAFKQRVAEMIAAAKERKKTLH